ncbi:phage portal protein, HK97 family/phage portal protein, PBSX family,TIGR01540 [Aneurinibacillus thermoaerophilus]|uniref:Phage portal protein, HK97 family/phage portal protein, PBSX family,TIGR01540 n=1 Tax=Aneurinibacillus thermoaerophilus TaxID=143495 RepID=A0A1G7WPT4_ANETH|nr:phage portal protein [Aneurinibacillus thermoaerophilus]SDG73904.1 phage portal protein, HK97 family/phage portal protein, PBSX family,TIGR01540 [Aneurinibacillus thermoaerophilus]
MKQIGILTSRGKFVDNEIMNKYLLKERKIDEKSKQIKDPFAGKYTDGLVVPPYNLLELANTLSFNPYHFRAVVTVAGDVAGTGYVLKPTVDEPNEENKKELIAFFDKIKPSVNEIVRRMLVDYKTTGNGYLEIIREGYALNGKPVGLDHIPSHTVREHVSGEKICQIRGDQKIWFKLFNAPFDLSVHNTEPKTNEERATEYLSLKEYHPSDDFYGIPQYISVIRTMYGDIARNEYNLSFFKNYGMPAAIVSVAGNFNPAQPIDLEGHTIVDYLEDQFRQFQENPHSTMLLTIPSAGGGEVKVEVTPIGTEQKDSSFQMYRKDNRDEILAAHGVPPYRLGIAETGSLGGSTAEESTEIYKRSIIEPLQQLVEAMINRIIREGFGITDWEFRFNDIDLEDMAKDLEFADALFQKGAITPNELIRNFGKKFGIEPDPDNPYLNSHYINGTPIDLEYIIEKMEKEKDQEMDLEQAESLLNKIKSVMFKSVIKNE